MLLCKLYPVQKPQGKRKTRLRPDYLNGRPVLPWRPFSPEKDTPLVVAVGTSPHGVRENETPIQAYATLKNRVPLRGGVL